MTIATSVRRPITFSTLLVYALLFVLIVPVLFPIYYIVVASVMSPKDFSTYPPSLWPSSFHPENLLSVFRAVPLAQQYLNSTIQAGIITLAQLVSSVLAAYAFVFIRFKAQNTVFLVFLATLMIPGEAIIIPNYLNITSWGLARGPATYIGLVLPFLASAFGTFLLRQAFMQVPKELREAALLDGSGHLRFIWSILLPVTRPAIATVCIYVFLTSWNQYFWPLLLAGEAKYATLQIGLSQLNDAEAADPGLVMAGVLLSLLPTLFVVVFFQRFIVQGLTAGMSK